MENVMELLKKYNQGHIIEFLNYLEENEKRKLIEQIHGIDLAELEQLYENTKQGVTFQKSEISPIKAINPDRLTKEEKEEYEHAGINVIQKNQFAVVTMAGGQGTRLGFEGPKGTFKIDVEPKSKYLFEIIVDTLQRANTLYGVVIPWYIMTSIENNEQTVAFLEEHDYFGYPKEAVQFFKQGELPLIDTEGKLLVGEDKKIRMASNGNGSIFESMRVHGVLEDMKQKGIQWVYIGSIDNVLLKMVDVLLIGVAIKQGSKIATRSAFKDYPEERIGTICKQDGKIRVIEYTEFPVEMMKQVDEEGELLYGESHIMCNLFSLEALDLISKQKLPYHKAFKKYAYLNEQGKKVIPETPNAYKFEYFIFDSFEFFDQISILRGKRNEDFAPVKNKEGVDSPESARKLYNAYWKQQNSKK